MYDINHSTPVIEVVHITCTQRIEAWWGHLEKHFSQWWIDFFQVRTFKYYDVCTCLSSTLGDAKLWAL